jgi:predicted ATPase/serine/threonine protein kinase
LVEGARECSICGRTYEDATRLCPIDGTPLRPIDPFVGQIVDAKYRIDRLIGRGGMGAVYRATQIALARTVAIKFLAPRSVPSSISDGRFHREARAIARLKHPNIVTVYDFGITSEGTAYLVLEYLAGRSLRDELRARGQLPASEAAPLVAQICAAAAAAHDAGIIHRDLKPDNVFVETTASGPVVKVFDFGIAKLHGDSLSGNMDITQAGAYVGTPKYAAPEQADAREVDGRADVYAIGCLLYELIAGRAPFEARTAAGLMLKHATELPRPLREFVSEIPLALDSAILRALEKRPEDRFQSATEFAQSLVSLRQFSVWSSGVASSNTPVGGQSDTSSTSDVTNADDTKEARASVNRTVPQPATSFVGRSSEVAEVRRLLASSRLVTLAGPGGIGKTRIAIEVANALAPRFYDGVWFVDLASLTDPARVAQAIAVTLGIPETSGIVAVDALCASIGERRMLVVLDNCEHIVTSVAAVVDSLVRRCPGVRLLATSQETLGVAGETIFRVPSLGLPRRSIAASASSVASFGAVALFVERATARVSSFRLDSSNSPAVAEICRRLDGIPLAIELAAARISVLSIQQIQERLKDRFRLLTGGGRTLMPRQQTLRATMDWSFGLLVPQEQALLRRLSVFSGTFSLVAVEGICVDEVVSEIEVLDLIARLVDKSLVAVVDPEQNRYRLSDTIREYAWEKLENAGEEERYFDAHRDWYVEYARGIGGSLFPPDDPLWFVTPELEYDNIRAVLAWTRRHGRFTDHGIRLCSYLGRFWQQRGYWSEGRAYLVDALEAAPPDDLALVARLNSWIGSIDYRRGEFHLARTHFVEALTIREKIGDVVGSAINYAHLGELDQLAGDLDSAVAWFERALESFRREGSVKGELGALSFLGIVSLDMNDLDRAEEVFLNVKDVGYRSANRHAIAVSFHNLGEIAWRRGDLTSAREQLRESIALAREQGNKRLVGHTLVSLGRVECDAGAPDDSAAAFIEALGLLTDLGDKRGICYALEGCACVESLRGSFERALLLGGFVEAMREQLHLAIADVERDTRERHLVRAIRALGPEASARLTERGRTIAVESAVALALESSTPSVTQTLGSTTE